MNNREKYREECNRIHVSEEWTRETAGRMEQAGGRPRKKRWMITGALAAALVCVLAFSPLLKPATVTVEAKENLMEGISAQKREIPTKPDSDFVSAQADFAVKLFQKTAAADKNSLVSPASAALALGMTANGAKGDTLSQFEALLGGGMDLSALNRNFASEQNALKSVSEGKLLLANSIWYRDKSLTVEKPFLQANADYFGSDAFRLDFEDPASVGKINGWVSKSTDGNIKKMVEKIDPSDMMFLMNALYLEQDWEHAYNGCTDDTFHAPGGDKTAKMMGSMETYLSDGAAEGILKQLKDPRYAFAAILPKNGTALNEYLKGLTGESFLSLMRSGGQAFASASLPKFKFDCTLGLNDALKSLGLSDAFDSAKADFSAMGSSPSGKLFINSVLQKTFIQADEKGLKAGAVTSVGMAGSSRPDHVLQFDRPFVIAVVDTSTDLPLFLGVVANPS
ncbi:serine protease [Caproiciproducens sp. NJN-50]|uniref:serpin family protein n=1 Tax=Acutalibacteraceae TaxID=3082771 RepID=UPI000FFE2F9C|nr:MULTISPECIES: serpin family protein [Acutalibacteraceae]QAT48442.1 serine protease [Caproiciproducens sp. NJN-50]